MFVLFESLRTTGCLLSKVRSTSTLCKFSTTRCLLARHRFNCGYNRAWHLDPTNLLWSSISLRRTKETLATRADATIFRSTIQPLLLPNEAVLGDKGYQGLTSVLTPYKIPPRTAYGSRALQNWQRLPTSTKQASIDCNCYCQAYQRRAT